MNKKGDRSTYCHVLWSSVFIDSKGDVFACCHSKPGMYGNIHKESLKNIIDTSDELRRFKRASLDGSLACSKQCSFPAWDNCTIHEKYPHKLWLTYGTFCNQRCIMCYQSWKPKRSLDNEILKKNIDWAKIRDIELQGGEILAMEGAKRLYLWLTQKLNKKIDLLTNGMLIDDAWARHLVLGSNWIAVSVNAATKATHELVNRGSNYGRVIGNIEKLICLKKRYNSKISIGYRFTIVKENICEIAQTIGLADKLGCDVVSFGYDESVAPFLDQNEKLRQKIKDQIALVMSNDLDIEVDVLNRLPRLGLLNR